MTIFGRSIRVIWREEEGGEGGEGRKREEEGGEGRKREEEGGEGRRGARGKEEKKINMI